jgi:hypothetical protein
VNAGEGIPVATQRFKPRCFIGIVGQPRLNLDAGFGIQIGV